MARRGGLTRALTCGPNDHHPAKEPYRTPPALRIVQTAATAASGDVVLERFPVDFDGYSYEGWIAREVGAPQRPQVLVIPNYGLVCGQWANG